MLDVCLLGTGGMMPLPYRWLTALMMRYNGKSILIDCGEGTQIALKEKAGVPSPSISSALPIITQTISADCPACSLPWEMPRERSRFF